MKKTNKFTFTGLMLLWFIVLSPSVLGTTEQFFPTDGTIDEYKLTFVFNWSNGTTEETARFEVWNLSGYTYLVPMPMLVKEPGLFADFNILESEVEITLTRTYSDLSPTQLNRTSNLKGNTTSFDENDIFVGVMMGKSSINGEARKIELSSRTIDKTNYWEGFSNDFVGYFDKDTALTEHVDFKHSVLAITDDSIIAFEVDSVSSMNTTYIADRRGKVNYFQYTRINPYPAMDADTVAFIWTRTRDTNDNSIPSYNVGIIITVMGSTVTLYVIKIKKSKKKQ